VSADTVQSNDQGMDPYAYVGENPETMVDPTEHFGSDPGMGANNLQGLNSCQGNLICDAQSDANQGSNEFWMSAGKLALLGAVLHLPEKRVAAIGTLLICGAFALASVLPLLSLLGIPF